MTEGTIPRALPLRVSDLRGLYGLGVDGTVGVTDLVEAMHHTIGSRFGFGAASAANRSSGITGFVYAAVRGTTRLVGRGVDAALRRLEPDAVPQAGTPAREAFLAALNGICGDHLADTGNPLAIRMTLRRDGLALDLHGDALARQVAKPARKLLVLVHGLCMNDRQWTRHGHDHGRALAQELGFTHVYLHYNSGRHVSENGREFAARLDQLVSGWPVPVDELVIVGHSMGGLVARSACQQAGLQGQHWLRSLSKLVCLGTPHHGAPLERGGRWVDLLLGLSPYVAPFARLGKARSAGITDLRFGNLSDADWQGRDRHAQGRDDRQPVPLPEGVHTYLLAASLAQAGARPPEPVLSDAAQAAQRRARAASGLRGRLHRKLIGDGLVPLGSALGRHRDPALALSVPTSHRRTVHGCGHLDLLCHADVHAQLRTWLGPA